MKLLSIVIPTYNRCLYLDVLLSRIQEISVHYEIQLIVCNNSSTDDTHNVVNKWKSKFKEIIIIEQNKNMGYDYNVASGYLRVTSKYVWILGDSYLVDINSFHKIMCELSDEPDILITNTRSDLTVETQIINEPDELLCKFGWLLTNLSGFIIKSEFINQNILKRFINTSFIHWGCLFESISYVDKICAKYCSDIIVNRNNYIKIKNHNKSKQDDWRQIPITVFGKHWFFTVMSLPNTYSRESKLKCLKDHARFTGIFNISTLAKQLCKGNIKRGDYFDNRLFIPFVMPQQRWKYDLIFLLVPTLPKSLHSFFRKIKHMLWPK